MISLEFIKNLTIYLEVDKILSENFLYRPTRSKFSSYLRLDNKVREYKEFLELQCEESGFHDDLRELLESYKNQLAIVSRYWFFIPESDFFTQENVIGPQDVTNMLKAVEDSILGKVIDDRYVLQTTIMKMPYDKNWSTIVADFDFYFYCVMED